MGRRITNTNITTMTFKAEIVQPEKGKAVRVKITREAGYRKVGQEMDKTNGRYLLAFYEPDETSEEGTEELDFQTAEPGTSNDPHWVIALVIVGTQVVAQDRKRIVDGHA